VLGPQLFGIFAVGLVIFNSAQQLVLWGLDSALPIRIARDLARGDRIEAEVTVRSGLVLSATLGAVGAGILWIVAPLLARETMHNASGVAVVRGFAIALPLTVVNGAAGSVLAGYKRIGWMVASLRVGANAGALVGVLLMVAWKAPVYMIPGAYLLSAAVGVIIAEVGLPASTREFCNSFSMSRGVDLLKNAGPLGLVSAMGALQDRIDVIILSVMAAPEQVGLYAAVKSFLPLFTLVFNSFGTIVLPVQAEAFERARQDEVHETFRTWIRWGVALSLPMAMIALIHHQTLIRLVLGPHYLSAGSSLQVLICALFFFLVVGHWRHLMRASGKAPREAKLTALGLTGTVMLGILLIPRVGIAGAALAYGVSFLAVNLIGLVGATGMEGLSLVASELPSVAMPAVVLFVGFEVAVRLVFNGKLSDVKLVVLLGFYYITQTALLLLLSRQIPAVTRRAGARFLVLLDRSGRGL
jgi:O-antigen/teichoic acid export membrane protein